MLIPALSIVTTANRYRRAPDRRSPTPSPSPTTARPPTPARPSPTPSKLLDDATYNNDAAATSGTVSYASPVITWTGDLAVGASAVITWTVTVHNPDTGDKTLVTEAASDRPWQQLPAGQLQPGVQPHRSRCSPRR